MKHLFLSVLSIAFAITVSAQTFALKNTPSTAEDYMLLLESKGYKSFAFDIASLKDATYWIEPVIQHYKDGKLVPNAFEFNMQFSNRDMLPSNNPEFVNQMRQAGKIHDEQKGILNLCEKIRVGFAPMKEQALRLMKFYVTEGGAISIPLVFDPQIDPETGKESEYYSYGFREFLVNEIKFDTFIPLAMCGAYWYDAETQHHRFCGDIVLTADMTSSLMKDVKEYYIIGMKVHK